MSQRMLLRDILQDASGGTTDNTLPLRIAAIFLILTSSLLGSLPPLFLKSFKRGSSSPIALLVRAFSAGVILALALVHVLPEGFADMESLGVGTLVGWTDLQQDYPIGGVTALFGVIVIVLMENIAHAVSRRKCHSGHHSEPQSFTGSHGGTVAAVGGGSVAGEDPSAHSHHSHPHHAHHHHHHHMAPQLVHHGATLEEVEDVHHHNTDDRGSLGSEEQPPHHQHHDHSHHGTATGTLEEYLDPKAVSAGNCINKPQPASVALGMPAAGGAGANNDGADHSHGCVSGLRASSVAAWFRLPTIDPAEVEEVRRYQVVALVMEMGCVFHSVLIGLTLGVNIDNLSTVRALTIALVFHQMLEGISLGSVIARAEFPLIKSLAMVLLYSLTTPIGIVIGICVSSTYNDSSITAMAVQGTLDCISGGLLLYIGLVQLIAEDFSREDMLVAGAWRLRLSTYSLLLLGAATMCVLAIWS